MEFRRRVKPRCKSGSMFSAIQLRTVPPQRGQTEPGFGDGFLVVDLHTRLIQRFAHLYRIADPD